METPTFAAVAERPRAPQERPRAPQRSTPGATRIPAGAPQNTPQGAQKGAQREKWKPMLIKKKRPARQTHILGRETVRKYLRKQGRVIAS